VNRSSLPFRGDIEGLRAVAVIGVVAYHFGLPGIPGGFVGVDTFFVISGYLITGLLIQELEKSGKIDLLQFYGRRARRLLPAVLLMTLVTLAVSVFVLSPHEQLRYARAAVASSLYASNVLFLRHALDYFAPQSALNPFLHTWSLAVEEQFYLVWPALLLMMSRGKLRSPRLAATIAGVTLISFTLCLWLTRFRQPWAFYASLARAWEFGIGGLAALAWVTRWACRSKVVPVVGWIAAGALLLSFALITEEASFPGLIATLPVAATVCVLISGAPQNNEGPTRILRTAPLQWLGRRSYSLYLWHWPIIILGVAQYPSISIAGRLACGALAVIFAAASYQWLEAPIRSNPWLAKRAIRSVGLGICLTLIGATTAVGAAVFAKHFAESPAQKAIVAAILQTPTAGRRGCIIGDKATKAASCIFGAPPYSPTIVLFGDSHADEWSTPLVSIANAEGWRLVTYLKSGCSVADIPVYNVRLHRMSDECAAWRANTIGAIVQLRPNVVVVGEFSSNHILGPINPSGKTVSMATWAAGLKRSLSQLRGAGSSIILLRDSPTPNRDIATCLERARWRDASQTCDIPRSMGVDTALTRTEGELAAAIPGVRLVDLTSEFCDETTCPAWRNGMVVYRDASHVANGYAASLTGPLRAALLSSIRR